MDNVVNALSIFCLQNVSTSIYLIYDIDYDKYCFNDVKERLIGIMSKAIEYTMAFPTSIGKWGNSNAIRLRKEFLDGVGLKTGQDVMVIYDNKNKQIIIKPMADK